MTEFKDTPISPVFEKQVHVYGPLYEHGDAYIVGSRNGLKALRNAIDRALNGEVDSVAPMMAADGEGYNLFIATEDKPFMWDQLQLPYTDGREQGAALHPVELILKYDQLVEEAWKDV